MQSQNYYESYKLLSEKFSSSPYSKNKLVVDSLVQRAISKNQTLNLPKIYNDFSLVANYADSIKDAIYYASAGVKLKKTFKQYDKDYVIMLYRIGAFYSKKKEFDRAIDYFEQVIDLDLIPQRTALAHCGIATCYYDKDDFYKSINYHEKGIDLLEKNELYKLLPREYFNLFTTYKDLGTERSLDLAETILQKIESLNKHITLRPYDYLKINNAYTVLYSNKLRFDFNKAKYYAKKNIELAELDNETYFSCTSYINLAKIYNIKKNDSALFYAKQALNYCKSDENLSKSNLHISRSYKNKRKIDSALTYIQKGINLVINKNQKNYYSELNLNELKKNKDKDHLLFLLKEKIELLNESENYKLSLNHVLVSDSLVNIIQNEIAYSSKLFWREKALQIYTLGIKACYQLNKPEVAFYLSEKGKALLLTESIINNKNIAQLPDSLKSKELELRKMITNSKIKNDENLLFNNQLIYDTYINKLKQKFPNYFKNKSLQNTISLNKAKDELDNKTMIVSYFYPSLDNEINQFIYALFITKNNAKLLRIADSKETTQLIKDYQKLITKPFTENKDKLEFNDISSQLYNTLLQPNENDLNNFENLVIIPDGIIHNTPFEALTTSKESLNYLIKTKNISYQYSLSFTDINNNVTRNTKNNLVGFAPVEFENLGLTNLSSSNSELNSASSAINGDVFLKNKATSESFFHNAKDSKIIHLATHAEASENPWIAFSDKKLSLEELYNFKNNAELTVLSGCETSLGEFATGEGVMSLARGFFYSGSNAVIASLWNVNDKSTSFIMTDFYKHLKSGDTKSKALRLAKLNYINTHSLSEVSPYYWSSFVLLGNADKIEFGFIFSLWHYYLFGFIAFIILLFLFYFKKK